MYVLPNHRVLYVDIPKTGSRTIQQTLEDNFQGGNTLPDHATKIPINYSQFFTFSVVRDPYDRACSLWWSTCKREVARKGFASKMEAAGLENTLDSFLIVLERVWNTADAGFRFARPQVAYTDGVKQWIKHEQLEQEFNKLPFVKTHITLPHLNPTRDVWKMNPLVRPPWEALKTDQSVHIINKLYQQDFDKFGYERED